MRRCLRCLLAAGAIAGLLGIAVVVSGIVPIGASTGHWALTEWVLHGAMQRSVATHALGTRVPSLDDPALVRRGAGHYAIGCAACHGAPDRGADAFAWAMTPRPPDLVGQVPGWREAELFEIVRHGVKMTGMPAWPALVREDEVWAMVAFLRHLPGMTAETYRALAGTDRDGEDIATVAGCAACHGADGAGSGAVPRLAGQNEAYLAASLEAFAARTRASGTMQQAVAGLDRAALAGLAAHYAAARAPVTDTPAGSDAGARLAQQGDPARGIPACASCHGLEAGADHAAYPSLAGQEAWYTAAQLRLLRDGSRGGSPYVPIMQAVAQRLDDTDIAALAAFYAALGPAGR